MPDSTGALINQLANPPNPFDYVSKATNALTGAREFQAKQAIADAYRQATDPVTGQVDQGMLNSIVSQGPGSFLQGQAMQQVGQGVGAQATGTREDLAAKADQLGTAANYMTPLMQKLMKPGGTVTTDEVNAALDSIPPGVLPGSMIANVRAKVDALGPGADASNLVRGAMFANQHAMEVVRAQMPNYGTISTGGNILPYQANPLAAGGPTFPTQPVPMTPGVEGTTLTVGTQTIPNVPYNVAIAISQNPELLRLYYPQQYAAMHPGDTISVGPQGGGGGGGGAAPGHYPLPPASPVPAPSSAAGTTPPATPTTPSRTPPASTAPAPAPASVPLWRQPPPPSPSEAGGVGLTPQPGYIEKVVVPSQTAATALATGAAQTSDISALIDDMRAQVNQPGWNTGLGAQAGSTWRQVLQRIGLNANPTGTQAQIDSAEAAANEFAKDANLIASRQLQNLGNPSDARQGLAEAITPGMAQSKEGVLGISATLKGNQDAINRTNTAWQQAKQSGWGDGQHLQWLNSNWKATDPTTGGRFDPRVFWLADTAGNADDQWRRFAQKIPKDQQTQFLKNVQYAQQQGWITQNSDRSFAVIGP